MTERPNADGTSTVTLEIPTTDEFRCSWCRQLFAFDLTGAVRCCMNYDCPNPQGWGRVATRRLRLLEITRRLAFSPHVGLDRYLAWERARRRAERVLGARWER